VGMEVTVMCRSFGFLDVKACLKGVFGLKAGEQTHGLFPCISEVTFLTLGRQGLGALILGHVDGGFFLD
jgi:hypothetical protein